MSNDSPIDMQEAFKAAKERFRVAGVGGMLESSDKGGKDIPKEENEDFNKSKKNINTKNGVVVLGNKNVKTESQGVQIHVFAIEDNTKDKGENHGK